MATHILIPIKDIENSIKILKQSLAVAKKEKDTELIKFFQIELENRQNIHKLGKQISLDEKDIDEILHKKYGDDNYSKIINKKIGYKQALKHLI